MRQALETEQKALEINLDENIYGAFNEIGAGQECARNFFQVGAAAGTIAKSMSAYDKAVSDDIYGVEPKGRYVSESRLYKMLDHEWNLMTSRLRNERPEANFFVFADTVAAINYHRTNQGSGWMGVRFQLDPQAEPNDVVLHVKMHDQDNQLQQQAVGILGVNLIYACFHYHNDPKEMLISLMDGLQGRVSVDMVQITGPDFDGLDNRLLSLWMVQFGLSEIATFGPDKRNLHPSEFLYRRSLMVVRGSFRPATLVNLDMLKRGFEQFREDEEVDPRKAFLLTEITLDNLMDGQSEPNEQDFLHRADVLAALGQTTVVSNCTYYRRLVNYMQDYKVPNLGIVIGVRQLLELVGDLYYNNLDGNLFAAFGDVFSKETRFYVYPSFQEGSDELMTAQNIPIPEGVRFIYQHLIERRHIVDIEQFNADNLHIFSKDVLEKIKTDEAGWEEMVPQKVANLVKQKRLFGFPVQKMEFDY